MTRTVPLSRGYVALVDDEDYEWLSAFKWCFRGSAKEPDYGYAVRGWRYTDAEGNSRYKGVAMHREIMGADGKERVDHVNGDRLDNRRSNLRLATDSQNGLNRGKHRRVAAVSSQFKGVYREQRRKNKIWGVRIQAAGKYVYVGSYETEEEAALAYDAAAKRHHGEFARLNFPRPQKTSSMASEAPPWWMPGM